MFPGALSRKAKWKLWAALLFLVSLVFLFRFPNVRFLPEALRYLRAPDEMAIPVEGLSLTALRSTWNAPRSAGRLHEGADLFAPRGTRVLSATRGTVWRVGTNKLGGNVVWVLGEGPALYYYAHLSRFEPGLKAGMRVERGAVLGRVGTSGNARGTRPHLHFGVYRLRWTGQYAVDPIPLLLEGARPLPTPAAPGPRTSRLDAAASSR